MPRYVVNESEDDSELKTGRKTRAALAASSATTDSPIRRSTRNRHGSVNPDGSSPESITGTVAPNPQVTTRVTRRRAAAAAANTTDLSTVPENHRALRSRKNSISSNVSDNVEPDSAPGTPRQRTIKRLSLIEPSPSTPKPAAKTRRSIRASSETKTPPPVRSTRRTRANSTEPEPLIDRTSLIATPTKKKRLQASAQPTEPVVTEEANESDDDIIIEIPEDESEDENSPEKTVSRSSSSSVKKSSKKNDSTTENTNAKVDADESLAEKSSEESMELEISSAKNKSIDEKTTAESDEQSSPIQVPVEKISATYNTNEEEDSPKQMQILSVKTKRVSLDKSKELGMKIEDLLNKSTDEQEKSPGNKENEKLNISTQKIKKNLEFTVSNVNVVRAKSLGSTKFMNKSVLETKMNTSLDEQVLFKSQYNSDTTKSKDIETNKFFNDTTNPEDSTLDKKLAPESPGAVKSNKKNHKKEQMEEENGNRSLNSKCNYTKIDETIVENEIIEEFTLYDSNDEDSRSEFCLMMEDDVKKKPKETETKKQEKDENVYPEVVSELGEENIGEAEADEKTKKGDSSPKKRLSLNLEETRESRENAETEIKEKTCEDKETNNPETENNYIKNIDEEEPMEINDVHEKDKSIKNSSPGKVSPKKQSCDRNESSKDEKNESSSNIEGSKSNGKNEKYDSDSNIGIDDLFQNISAEEWNKKQKNRSPEKKRRSSLKAKEETLRFDPTEEPQDQTDSKDEKDKSLKEKQTEDCDAAASDSEDTLVKKNDSAEKVTKKRRSSTKIIVEEAESVNEESAESLKGKKSPKKSNRLSTESKIDAKEKSKRNSMSKSQEEEMEVDENSEEKETIPRNIDNPTQLKEDNSDTTDVEEDNQPESTKNTPKEKKNKSSVRSATKLKKSVDIYEFEDSFDAKEDHEESDDSSDEDKTTIFGNKKGKKSENENMYHQMLSKTPKTPKTPMNRNISILAVADSDSGRENIDDLDEESSDNNEKIMPGFLFNVESSDDANDSDMEDEDKSQNTIDSDIAREMNLAGDDNVAYSDDDVQGDECRASESEHSDENDGGSDMDDFVVGDDDVESSEYSEEDSEPKIKFKRILAQSLSEEDDEENDESDEEIEAVKSTDKKQKKESIFETPKLDITTSENELAEEFPKLERKMLEYSFASDKSLSNKKMKKAKIAADLGESELSDLPSTKENLPGSDKKLKKLSKPIKSLLNSTVDLCTPEQNAVIPSGDKNKTPDLNISVDKKKRKSAQKLKKNLVEDLNKTKDIEGEEEEEVAVATLTPKAKTPIKEKKTPKSLKKNQRDSIQLIAEVVTLKPQISDLNKSMSTPNSESPATKYLKKERLNESLPFSELKKKKRSKSFDNKTLSNMEEEEQDQEGSDNAEENDNDKEIENDSENDESEGYDEIEENGNEINGNSQGDDDEDERDEESDDEEENEPEDHNIDENENDEEEEEEEDGESSNEEIGVIKKGKYVNEKDEEPDIKKIEKSRKSKDRKSLTAEIEDAEIITPSKKESAKKRQSKGSTPSSGVNGKAGESPDGEKKASSIKKHQLSNAEVELPNKKKRARLEFSETPQNLKITKKLKIITKTDEIMNNESDSDEAPESLGFVEARQEALQEMKDVATSLKAAKEAKKKKRREQLDRIRKEKEAKASASASKKETAQEKIKTQSLVVGKNTLKRLPEDLLDVLSDLPERPKKKRKLANKKEEEKIVPSKYMFSPGKSPKSSLKVEDYDSPVSTGGGTTHFSVINIEKVKKQSKKAVAAVNFREKMLNRNPRQPISAFLMYHAKQKASGKQLFKK